MNEPEFLSGVACKRCGGPILNEPHKITGFLEESLDYPQHTVWPCYACGKQHTENQLSESK